MSRRLWFMTFLGRALVPKRLEALCDAMGYTNPADPERRLILERFRGRFSKTAEQCTEFYPLDAQLEDVPGLDKKVEGWVRSNIGFFTSLEEIEGIMKYYDYMRDRKLHENERDKACGGEA